MSPQVIAPLPDQRPPEALGLLSLIGSSDHVGLMPQAIMAHPLAGQFLQLVAIHRQPGLAFQPAAHSFLRNRQELRLDKGQRRANTRHQRASALVECLPGWEATIGQREPSALGFASLPTGAAVEVEAIFEVE